MTTTLDSSPSPAQNPGPADGGRTRHPGKAPRWVRGVYIANLVAQSGLNLTGAIGVALLCWYQRTWQAFWVEAFWALLALKALL